MQWRLVVVAALVACGPRALSISQPRSVESDHELSVVAAVLDQVVHARAGRPTLLEDSTLDYTAREAVPATTRQRLTQRLGATDTLIAAFIAANRQRRQLTEVPTQLQVIQYISASERSAALRRAAADSTVATDLWASHRERFPNTAGITRVSRVGIVEDRALIRIHHACGGLCGHISLVLLGKEGACWRVIGSFAEILF